MTSDSVVTSVVTWAQRYSVIVGGAAGNAETLIGDDFEAIVLSSDHMNTSIVIGCKSRACSVDAAELDGSIAMLFSPNILADNVCVHVSTVTYRSSVVFSAATAYFESKSGVGLSAAPPLLRQGLHSLVMNARRFRRLHIYHLLLGSSQTASLFMCLPFCPTFSLFTTCTTLHIGLRCDALGSASPNCQTMLPIIRSICTSSQSFYVAVNVHPDTLADRGPACLAIVALFALLLQHFLPSISTLISFRRRQRPHFAAKLLATYVAFAAIFLQLPNEVTAQVI
jgi:hypothetical protein